MHKQGNTHHYKNPIHIKKMKLAKGDFGGGNATPTWGTYGLTFAAAAYNYMTFSNPQYIFSQTSSWTFDFIIEINNTNKNSGTYYLFTHGRQGSAQNYMFCKLGSWASTITVYDNSSTAKSWTSASISGLSNGLHRFTFVYDRTVPEGKIYIDGVASSITTSGAGSGVITANTNNTRYWLGGDSYWAVDTTSGHFVGDIVHVQYSPYARSAADVIKRQGASVTDKCFPIDKYTVLDWNAGNNLLGMHKINQAARKYGG